MLLAVARMLGSQEYGRFASLFGICNLLAFLALGGQHTFALKELSAFEIQPNDGRASWIIRRTASALCAFSIAMLFLIAACGWVCERWLAEIQLTPSDIIPVFLLSAFLASAEYVASVLRATGSVIPALAPRDVIWRSVSILSVFYVLSKGIAANATMAVYMIAIALGTVVLLQILYFVRRFPSGSLLADRQPTTTTWASDSLWYCLASLAGIFVSHASASLVLFALDAERAGSFFASQRLSQLLQLPLFGLNTVLAPHISRCYHSGDLAGAKAACRKSMKIVLIPTLLLSAVTVLFSPQLLGLFAEEYRTASTTLNILVMSSLVFCLTGPTGVIMMMADGHRQAFAQTLIGEGLGLLLMFPMAVVYGLEGAALAVLFGATVRGVLAVIWIRRKLKIDPSVMILFGD